MKILDGKKTSLTIQQELAQMVKEKVGKGLKRPHLAAILVGDDGPSQTYVNAKVKACDRIGFKSTLIKLESTISEDKLLDKIHHLNADHDVDGFIVQLPLPDHIDESKVTLAIDPKKDVDGFHPMNVGNMTLGLPAFLPATPNGIIELLKRYDVETEGKNCVVIGRSSIVGTPVSILLSRKSKTGNATVTLAHSRTKDLPRICKSADIIVVAIGRPLFLTEDMVKEGAVIIDVGIHRINDETKKNGFRLIGDVDFDNVAPKTSYITPVPGGVGPMTIASLLLNTYKSTYGEDN
ncbi:MAG: bifunctional methylenetetrahydrofolate dehydrogenase/methenyltetrahydrofolate cyclohydrolase FolD [Bacteroidota bacterium]|nr:bifunctional methylenetetrahydrofolate dehydrogenase/methenyltetrahydrofolate cyclohydrolase FolD [Bacteroidota bacterium]MEC9231913.1 bifunctional methylenetetrahydrofolate dehydrogenase/methenyltetrahydrofolate cyclohydrolase FolD [Bacteroidota bacterium]MEE3097004.1 bifunctional methylenetetrahydrofolate dehydrogenase/methenyltetrahydrofolate cyclohydrolase FolD [Bacteroidota bacterium]